jgi:hypothetical protein
MSLAIQTRVIDGKTYTIPQLPGRASLKMLNRLGKAIGPAFAALMGTVKAQGSKPNLADLDFSAIGGAVEALFTNVSDEDLDYFIDNLLKDALVDNVKLLPQIDLLFQGSSDTLIKVLAFAVTANYANFSRALAGFLGGASVQERK